MEARKLSSTLMCCFNHALSSSLHGRIIYPLSSNHISAVIKGDDRCLGNPSELATKDYYTYLPGHGFHVSQATLQVVLTSFWMSFMLLFGSFHWIEK